MKGFSWAGRRGGFWARSARIIIISIIIIIIMIIIIIIITMTITTTDNNNNNNNTDNNNDDNMYINSIYTPPTQDRLRGGVVLFANPTRSSEL